MKSKISCFNKTIFMKNMTHFWPIWLAYAVYMIIVLPVNIWQKMSITYPEDVYDAASRKLNNLSWVLENALEPFGVFLFAVVAVMAVFSYLFSAKNANMIHALPVNRKELFVTNFLSGFIFMVIPEIIAFIAAVFVCLGYQIASIETLFVWLVCIIGMTFFALSMATFVAMLTGQLLAVPAYYFIANYLFIGVLYIIKFLINTICYGVSWTWNLEKISILSPIYYLEEKVGCESILSENGNAIVKIAINGEKQILIYAFVAVVILVLAYLLYRKRPIETAGDMISISYVKPVFRWGVALCSGFLIPEIIIEIVIGDNMIQHIFTVLVVSVLLIGTIAFFGAEMLIQKSFKVFRKKRILECTAMLVVFIGILGMFKLDIFGIEKRIPTKEEVEKCYLYLDYAIDMSGEQEDAVLALHKQLLEEKESTFEYISNSGKFQSIEIKYVLKEGKVLERNYYIPVGEEYIADADSAISKMAAIELEEENLLKCTFGNNYETNEYYSGHIELYDAEGNYDTYRFDEKELPIIIEAITEDIKAGNYGWYQVYSVNNYEKREKEEFFNSISLAYYNEDGISYTADDYYAYQRGYYEIDEMAAQSYNGKSSSSYICFGKRCENIINALEELGVINEEWKLYTYEEYEKIEKW